MTIALLSLALATMLASGPARTSDLPRPVRNADQWIHGGNPQQAKAVGDTIVLMGPWGSGAPFNGQFENPNGAPAWNGWTSVDNTQPTDSKWHADTYNVVSGAWSAWCGEDYPSCGGGDPDGGYGNGYDESLEWRAQVADPALPCTLTVDALLNHDVEPGYDHVWLSVVKAGFADPLDLWSTDGAGTQVPLHVETVYQPGDYAGPNADEVIVRCRVTSDGAWSDQDCSYPSIGACQLDDVTVTLDNGGAATFDDFEDGTLGNWAAWVPTGVGDFAHIWTSLQDADPCRQNSSPQVAFIDDGVVVPGTGGSICINWCYGPGGHIVTTTGGLAGPEAHIDNMIHSPPIPWPGPEYFGCRIDFDVYRHEDLGADAPGISELWGVRSTSSPNPADLEAEGWQDRDSGFRLGGPSYLRVVNDVSDLVRQGSWNEPEPPRWVQLRLGVFELGWAWGWTGDDGYPAPYFDNVRVTAFKRQGPQFSARELDLANDAFIERDGYDSLNPGANHVRFDMAHNISLAEHLRNDPGDSLVFDCSPRSSGAQLTGNPRMYYSLKRNPIFDQYRTSGLPDQGYVLCDSVFNASGLWSQDRFSADLPDTGFLFPGDRLRYFIWAEDTDGITSQAAFLPADTSGFSDWSDWSYGGTDSWGYRTSSFTVRALPTITSLDGAQPTVLFWNDFANLGGQDEWYAAFANLGLVEGRDYDEYYTNSPGSGAGNGLGGRASAQDIAGYGTLLYTSGDLAYTTIANGDFNVDASDDAGLLTAWLGQGGKAAFLTGNELASDLLQSGPATGAFLGGVMGVSVIARDVTPLVAMQAVPRVVPETGNPVFVSAARWLADAGCYPREIWSNSPGIDAVTPTGSAVRLAQFADPAGNTDVYPYAAAVLNVLPSGSRVVSLPYDLMFLRTDPAEDLGPTGTLAARVRILRDVLNYFGIAAGGEPSDVPGAPTFTAASHPNPFNPTVRIDYTLPRAGRATLKIYDVRGALVRTLVDEVRTGGPGETVWRGEDDRGARVASGIYFYELRLEGEVRVGKMTLVK
jgi:hypothetical protein